MLSTGCEIPLLNYEAGSFVLSPFYLRKIRIKVASPVGPEYSGDSEEVSQSQVNECLLIQNWNYPAMVEETGCQISVSLGKSALLRMNSEETGMH